MMSKLQLGLYHNEPLTESEVSKHNIKQVCYIRKEYPSKSGVKKALTDYAGIIYYAYCCMLAYFFVIGNTYMQIYISELYINSLSNI